MMQAHFTVSALVGVERAIGDFRRGLPVVITGADEAPVLALAAELAQPETVQALAVWRAAQPVG